MRKRYLILILSLFVCNLFAQEIAKRPNPLSYVNDYDNILSPAEKESLEKKLVEKKDIASITVVIFKSLDDEANDYAAKLYKSWELEEVSKKEVLMLVDFDDREYAIVSSPELAHVINKNAGTKIEDVYIKHHFRDKEYYKGLDEASNVILGLVGGNLKIEDIKRDEKGTSWIFILIGLFVFFIIVFPVLQYRAIKKNHMGTKSLDFLSGLVLLNSFGAASRAGYNDFSKAMEHLSEEALVALEARRVKLLVAVARQAPGKFKILHHVFA